MKLFDDVAPQSRLHPTYALIKEDRYAPERAVLEGWADGFVDRDGKFCYEFQTTFESCLWELYLHAMLKALGANINFSHNAPDFVAKTTEAFCIEATIAAPPTGGKPAYGYNYSDIPDEFNTFNSQSTVRLCNSFTSKVKKLRESYSSKPHVAGHPFVIAIASFDRPLAHFAASRPIISALYGLYHDEDMTIATGARDVISYNVDAVIKSAEVTLPVGYFTTGEYSDVSAVIYSSVATWGKIRALADSPESLSIYTTFHPNPDDIHPHVRRATKAQYKEDLLDGLYVFHNPFANYPLDSRAISHPRIAQVFVRPDGELNFVAPDDFLLLRFINTVTPRG